MPAEVTRPSGNLNKEELKAWQEVVFGKSSVEERTELSDKDKAAIAMIATGSSKETVTKILGLSQEEVSEVITSKLGLELLCKIQDGLGMTAEERLCKAANLAVAKQIALLNSSNDKLASEAARYILDQAIGKALQRQEVRNYTLVADATSIRAKYDAVQEQLQALDQQRKALLASKQKAMIDV
jgi:hypothetical protein